MNATDIVKYGQLPVLQSINGFPETAWETSGVCGIWSVKDIIAHLASYEQVLVDVLGTFTTEDAATPMLDAFIAQGNQFNTLEVSRRKAKTIQEVLAEFNDAHSQVISLMAKISPEMLRKDGTLPRYGMEYALDDVLVYMYYGHKREHSAQITAFRDQMR